MNIAKIAIENFRSIKKLEYRPRDINIVIGPTNSGKSSLLHALALVLDPDVAQRYRPFEDSDFYGMSITDAEGKPVECNISVTITDLTKEDRNYYIEKLEPLDVATNDVKLSSDSTNIFDQDGITACIRIAFRAWFDSTEESISYQWFYPKFFNSEHPEISLLCPRADRVRVGFFLIPAERDAGRAFSFTRNSTLDRTLRSSKVNLEPQTKTLVEGIKDKADVLFDNAEFAGVMKEFEEYVSPFIALKPGIDRRLSFQIASLNTYELMTIVRGLIALPDQDIPLPISKQGMGARQLLVLSALRLLAKKQERMILAVEEPEIGLEPHLERSLARDLCRTAGQSFITTHSTHISRTFGSRAVYKMFRTPETTRLIPVHPSKKHGCPEESLRKLYALSTKIPTELLTAAFAPSVLLLEGISDVEAIPILFTKLAVGTGAGLRDLDGLGIQAIGLDGKDDIPHVGRYFRDQLKTRVFAVVDADKNNPISNTADTFCDCLFLLPRSHALEKVLVHNISNETIEAFRDTLVNTGLQTLTLDLSTPNEWKDRVFEHLCKRKIYSRILAELTPVGEVSPILRQLLIKLNNVDKLVDPEVSLDYVSESRSAEVS